MMKRQRISVVFGRGCLVVAGLSVALLLFLFVSGSGIRWGIRQGLRWIARAGDVDIEVGRVSGRLWSGIALEGVRVVDRRGETRLDVARIEIPRFIPLPGRSEWTLDGLRVVTPTLHVYAVDSRSRDAVKKRPLPSETLETTTASWPSVSVSSRVHIRNLCVVYHRKGGATLLVEGGRADVSVRFDSGAFHIRSGVIDATFSALGTQLRRAQLTSSNLSYQFANGRDAGGWEGTVFLDARLVTDLPAVLGRSTRHESSVHVVGRFSRGTISTQMLWQNEWPLPMSIRLDGQLFPKIVVNGAVSILDENGLFPSIPLGRFRVTGASLAEADVTGKLSYRRALDEMHWDASARLVDGTGTITSRVVLSGAVAISHFYVTRGRVGRFSTQISSRDGTVGKTRLSLSRRVSVGLGHIDGELACERRDDALDCNGSLMVGSVTTKHFSSDDVGISTRFSLLGAPGRLHLHALDLASGDVRLSIDTPTTIRVGAGRFHMDETVFRLRDVAIGNWRIDRVSVDARYTRPHLFANIEVRGDGFPSDVPRSLKVVTRLLGGWRGQTDIAASQNRLRLHLERVSIERLMTLIGVRSRTVPNV